MDWDLKKQISVWYEEEAYDKIIEALENQKEQDYSSIVFLAGIYTRRGEPGDTERADALMNMIADIELKDIGTSGQADEEQEEVELYDEEDLDLLDQYIEEHFGEYTQVFHEMVSLDIHLDVCIIPPGEDRNFYTLVTMGMGAHIMDVPENLSQMELERAELMICLPEDWDLESHEEKWYWPIRLLKTLARIPIKENSWLAWGHTIDYDEPFDVSTGLCGAVLIDPVEFGDIQEECILSDGSEVNFYQVIPLYREELNFKQEAGAENLLKKLSANVTIVNPSRKNYCRLKMLS